MLIGSGRGWWALSIELGRYCLLKGGLTMEPYLGSGTLLTPSNPPSFVKAPIGVPRATSQSGFPHSLISDGSVVDVVSKSLTRVLPLCLSSPNLFLGKVETVKDGGE